MFKHKKKLIYTNLGLDDMIFSTFGCKTVQSHSIEIKNQLLRPKSCACFTGNQAKEGFGTSGLITLTSRISQGLRFPHVEIKEDAGVPIVIQFYPSFKPLGDYSKSLPPSNLQSYSSPGAALMYGKRSILLNDTSDFNIGMDDNDRSPPINKLKSIYISPLL